MSFTKKNYCHFMDALCQEHSQYTLPQIQPSTFVLTANQRQARYLRKELNHALNNNTLTDCSPSNTSPKQSRAPYNATITICTVDNWVRQQYYALQDQAESGFDRKLISNTEAAFLWEKACQKTDHKPPLIDTLTLSELAIQTHNTIEHYLIPDSVLQTHDNEELAFFLALRQQMLLLLECEYVETPLSALQRVHNYLANTSPTIQNLYFYGFAELSPLIKQVASLAADTIYTVAHRTYSTQHIDLHRFDTTENEIQAAAAQAYAIWKAEPSAHIAVIVPQLKTLQSTVEQYFFQLFEPGAYLNSKSTAIPNYFDISAGHRLSDMAIIDTSLRLLQWQQSPLEKLTALALLQSGYWGEGFSCVRQELCERIRREPSSKISRAWILKHLQSITEKHALNSGKDNDVERLTKVLSRPLKKYQSLANWTASFVTILKQCDWPGPITLTSFEYQAVQTFFKALQSLQKIEFETIDVLSLKQFGSYLRRWLEACVFHPEVKRPRVHILGLMEAAGLHFDHAIIVGLNEQELPSTPAPDPLLPTALQIEYNTPKSHSQREYQYSAALLDSVIACAQHITVSYSSHDDTGQLAASPLLSAYVEDQQHMSEAPEKNLVESVIEKHIATTTLDKIAIGHAPAIPIATELSGGAYHLNLHRINPLYAFFKYRLRVSTIEHYPLGLDMRQRGNLVHAVAAEIYTQYPDQASLQAWLKASDANIELEKSIDQHMQSSPEIRALSRVLHDYEKQRLQHSLYLLLDYDANRRHDWQLLSCESSQQLSIQQRILNLRIDRIDQSNDGAIIIDYKTGKPKLSAICQHPVKDYQLPLYAMLYDAHSLNAVCYACVHETETYFLGLSHKHTIEGVSDITTLKNSNFPQDWQACIDLWRSDIEERINRISRGEAYFAIESSAEAMFYTDYLMAVREEEIHYQMQRPAPSILQDNTDGGAA